MKKLLPLKLLLTGMLLGASSLSSHAASGIFGYGIELTAAGANVTHVGTTLYALNDGGGTRLLPVSSTATLNQTSWLTSPETPTPTFSLGTFDTSAGDTLILNGGSMLTYAFDGDSFNNNQFLNYRVYKVGDPVPPFPAGIQLTLNETSVDGNANDTRWSTESQSIDLLAGLTPGTYVLATYGFGDATNGAQFANNGGSNYGATFTVVPEPGAIGMLAGGLGVLVVFRRWRRPVLNN